MDENEILKKKLSQKPQALAYTDSSDDEPTEVVEKVHRVTPFFRYPGYLPTIPHHTLQLGVGDAVVITHPVHLGNEYAVVGECGVVSKVPGDDGMAAVLQVGHLTFNAPQRYFKKTRNPYEVGEKVKFNKSIKLRSGKVIDSGEIGVVQKVPGDYGAVAEVLVCGIAYDATPADIRRYAGLQKQKSRPTPTSVKPQAASAPAAPRAESPKGSAAPAAPSPRRDETPAAPASPAAPAVPAAAKRVEQKLVTDPKDLLVSVSPSVPSEIARLSGKYTPTDEKQSGEAVWKAAGKNAWLYSSGEHWVVTDDKADMPSGKGWFYGKAEVAPHDVKTWSLTGEPAAPGQTVRVRTWRPEVLTINTQGIATGVYKITADDVHSQPIWELQSTDSKAYLYSSASGYWGITDDKKDFADGHGFYFTTAQHNGAHPSAFSKWVMDGQEKTFTIVEAENTTVTTHTKFAVGTAVRVRDNATEDWRDADVVSFDDKGVPLARVKGFEKAYSWTYMEVMPKEPSTVPKERDNPNDSKEDEKQREKDKEKARRNVTPEFPMTVRLSTRAASLAGLAGKYRKDGIHNGRPVYAHQHCQKWLFTTKGDDGSWCVTDTREDFLTESGFLHSKEPCTVGPQQVEDWLIEHDVSDAFTTVRKSEPVQSATMTGNMNEVESRLTLEMSNGKLKWVVDKGTPKEVCTQQHICVQNNPFQVTETVDELSYFDGLLKDPTDGGRRIRLNSPPDELLRDIAELAREVSIPAVGFPPPEGEPPTTSTIGKRDKEALDKARVCISFLQHQTNTITHHTTVHCGRKG